ncbi:hypothetical protein BDV93DRAFT_191121 [Ceratobasidium sp. AG-I]|nr:hypothetical protein BDV93DRAFT_191121 [Ceratobasidium sp. AG-I]
MNHLSRSKAVRRQPTLPSPRTRKNTKLSPHNSLGLPQLDRNLFHHPNYSFSPSIVKQSHATILIARRTHGGTFRTHAPQKRFAQFPALDFSIFRLAPVRHFLFS